MSLRLVLRATTLTLVLMLSACGPPFPPPSAEPGPSAVMPGTPAPSGSAEPAPEVPSAPAPQPVPAPKQYRLSAAATALVNQAHAQHQAGNGAVATATLERALRIEPSNPLLWLELARQNQDDGNPAQADSMARKALQLGRGDPRVQSAAWQLIAASLRARGRNQEASEAERRASLASG